MDWMEVLSNFVQAFLLAAAPVLAVFVVKAVKAWIDKTLAEAQAQEPELFDQVSWIAQIAVQAAEQSGVVQLAQEKKAFALSFVEKWLSSKGLTLDLELIDGAIEAAVFELKKSK